MACLDGVAHHCGVCDRSVDDADELKRELDSLKAQLATEREAHARTLAALEMFVEEVQCYDAELVAEESLCRARAAIAAAKVTP